jgi:DNA-binding transcriptional regulator YiaG
VADLNDLRRWAVASYRLRAIDAAERRRIRDLAGVTRATLAELLGVSWDRVRAYESGDRTSNPTGEDAARYLDALDAMSAPYATAMDPEQRADIRARFDQYQKDYPVEVCEHCRGIHPRACPRVKRVVYDDHRRVTEVEYWPDEAWSKDHVIFPDGPEMMDGDGED